MSTTTDSEGRTDPRTTTVALHATGHVRDAMDQPHQEFTFEGHTLRDLLEKLFDEQPGLAEMLVAETEAEATTDGWAKPPENLPGTWHKNPEGEQTKPYARVLVNGKFNEVLDGFDTKIEDEDRVSLVYPFIFCC
ncbi:pterin cluster protein [Haloplanus rallus]|jgi:molybdopterin converting factor small subunit|uniref:Pterin cluster protein n=1 Tax=Haloplanus rallus TaxID=1816183 RepID=A0A6B9F7F2_9EURY|nr:MULTISPECIES: pterin cluster protein [Haloplanus]QGX96386.1 pterin cluster protein [Haloplanus rallus]